MNNKDLAAPSGQPALVCDEARTGLHPSGFDQAQLLHILQHSLGVDQYGRGNQYRNHFVTGEGGDDWLSCMALVEAGHMTRRTGWQLLPSSDDLFVVTDAGKCWVAENSPQPPKLTKSQQRYQDYLDHDSDLSFGEWLKRHAQLSSGKSS
jgi:hypothetical protein